MSSPEHAELVEFEKYEIVELHRSEIHGAPYNPRTMPESSREKLKRNIANIGLLGPIIWNKTTGNIVGGHQRISVIDALKKSRNYRIRVAAVELTLEQEKAQNIFLNNTLAMGEFDWEKVEEMFRVDKVDYESAGFDLGEVVNLFGGSVLEEQSDKLTQLADSIRQLEDWHKETKGKNTSRDIVDYYFVAVFRNGDERADFNRMIGLPPDDYYIDGRYLVNWMKSTGMMPSPDIGLVTQEMLGLPEDCTEEEFREALANYEANDKSFARHVKQCNRCGEEHRRLVFRLLDVPTLDETHWATCPSTGEPIIIKAKSKLAEEIELKYQEYVEQNNGEDNDTDEEELEPEDGDDDTDPDIDPEPEPEPEPKPRRRSKKQSRDSTV